MAENKKSLALAVIEWLKDSLNDGTIRQDDQESIDVATQCISEAFGIDPEDEQQKNKYSIRPAKLQQIFDVALKAQQRQRADQPAASTSSTQAPSSGANPAATTPDPESLTKAEALKAEGNKLMSDKSYEGAVVKYTEAINLAPNQAVYFSNRAAAYSQLGRYDEAIEDARQAARVDPKFSKAYSRLGHALYSSGRFSEAATAYQQGLDLDPTSTLMKTGLETAQARAREAEGSSDVSQNAGADGPDAGAGAGGSGFGGFPGMGGAGGMPDLSSIMNNPMFSQMAQNLMANGGLDRLLQNPQLRQMAEGFGQGGGMPDMSQLGQLMNDPSMREMARNMMGGFGGGARGEEDENAGSGPNSGAYS